MGDLSGETGAHTTGSFELDGPERAYLTRLVTRGAIRHPSIGIAIYEAGQTNGGPLTDEQLFDIATAAIRIDPTLPHYAP